MFRHPVLLPPQSAVGALCRLWPCHTPCARHAVTKKKTHTHTRATLARSCFGIHQGETAERDGVGRRKTKVLWSEQTGRLFVEIGPFFLLLRLLPIPTPYASETREQ